MCKIVEKPKFQFLKTHYTFKQPYHIVLSVNNHNSQKPLIMKTLIKKKQGTKVSQLRDVEV